MKYPVGTKYVKNNKRKDVCTVVDFHTTTNMAGEVIRMRYVTSHAFMGQTVLDHDVPETEISRCLST